MIRCVTHGGEAQKHALEHSPPKACYIDFEPIQLCCGSRETQKFTSRPFCMRAHMDSCSFISSLWRSTDQLFCTGMPPDNSAGRVLLLSLSVTRQSKRRFP